MYSRPVRGRVQVGVWRCSQAGAPVAEALPPHEQIVTVRRLEHGNSAGSHHARASSAAAASSSSTRSNSAVACTVSKAWVPNGNASGRAMMLRAPGESLRVGEAYSASPGRPRARRWPVGCGHRCRVARRVARAEARAFDPVVARLGISTRRPRAIVRARRGQFVDVQLLRGCCAAFDEPVAQRDRRAAGAPPPRGPARRRRGSARVVAVAQELGRSADACRNHWCPACHRLERDQSKGSGRSLGNTTTSAAVTSGRARRVE